LTPEAVRRLRPELAVYFLTGVPALLAEALYRLSDIFVAGFLLKDVSHQLGRVPEEVKRKTPRY
jgi:hypothetical protein